MKERYSRTCIWKISFLRGKSSAVRLRKYYTARDPDSQKKQCGEA